MAAPTPEPPSARLGTIRAAGLAATVAVAAVLPWSPGARALSGPAVAAMACLSFLIPELVALRSAIKGRREPPRPPDGARPADGVVDIVAMSGVESAPCEGSDTWRRFVAPANDDPRPARRPGAVAPLLGRVALISVFVGRDGRAWTDREIDRAHRGLERAGAWLEREAACWGAPVNVVLPDVFFRAEDDADEAVELAFQPEGDDVGPMEAGAASKAVASASRVAARLGFADVVDLAGRIEARVDADVRVWLFHILRSGRSLAILASDPDSPGLGLAICHAREASFPGKLSGAGRVDPVTVVHELLHLCGASDKYGVDLDTFPTGSVGPRDVMRLEREDLLRLVVGPLTAIEVGWLGRLGDRKRKTPAANPEGRGGRE